MPPRRPILLLLAAVALCAALVPCGRLRPQIRPACDSVHARIEGHFLADTGWYPGEPFVTAKPVKAWGSWAGNDANTGTLTLGPFRVGDRLRFGVSGYPTRGIELYLQHTVTGERRRLEHPDVGERWRISEHPLPPAWRNAPLLFIAIDRGQSLGGWVAVTEPIRGDRSDGLIPLASTFATWACNTLLYALLWLAAARLLTQNPKLKTQNQLPVPSHWLPLVATALVALAGYLTFWAYFTHPLLGRFASAAVLLLALLTLWRHRHASFAPDARQALRHVAALGLAISIFYLALLHLFPSSLDFYSLAANRFRPTLPNDNTLPFSVAERLLRDEPLRQPDADWLSSDRPPLQSGWQLLALPLAHALGFEPDTASGTAAIWLQLAWIPAAYGLLLTLGLARPRAIAWIAALSLSGFLLQNTTFTWPKLSAAAFTLAVFALLFPVSQISNFKSQIPLAATLAALAWLSHGGVAFSFLAFLPLLLWRLLRDAPGRHLRPWLLATAVFAILVAPWIAYQKFYDPPGNRLLKWHLGGQIDKDPRGTLQTIREAYAALPLSEILAAKRTNFAQQLGGRWPGLFDVSSAHVVDRRNDEFFYTARAFTVWLLGLVALPVALLLRSPLLSRAHLFLALWLAFTVPVWCFAMFAPGSAFVHQGSYAFMLGAFILLSAWLEAASRFSLVLIVVLQAVLFFTTWVPANWVVGGTPHPLAIALAALSGLALLVLVCRAFRPTRVSAGDISSSLASHSQSC